MAKLVPYERARGAIHDLAALADLDSRPCHLLCVSSRTLYLLHNLAAADVTFFGRYAEELAEYGYWALERDSPLWSLFSDVVAGFQLEVRDMTCDIESGLNAVADALAALRCGCGGGQYGPATLECIVNLSNEDLLGPDDADQGNPQFDPPPEGFATWEEYFVYKCQAANFIWALSRKHMVALRTFDGLALTASMVGPVIAGLAGALPAVFTPAGFAVFVASVVAIGVTAGWAWFYMDEMISWWDDNRQEIVCSLYNAGQSPQAVEALGNALEDAIQAIVAWGSLEPIAGEIAELLSGAFGQLAGNGIVAPLFTQVAGILPVADPIDCSACQSGGCLDGPQFDPGCGPASDEPCGSGSLQPGVGRVWESFPHPSDSTHRIDARLDANRLVSITNATDFTPGFGDQSVRVYECNIGGVQKIASGTVYGDIPYPICGGVFVFVSATPFTITADIGDTC
jgi:hypothetical protein